MQKDSNRYSRNVYAQFEMHDRNQSSDTNHLEKKDTFRESFSVYSIDDDAIMHQGGELWDQNNLGGVPVDYDRTNRLVYIDSSESHTLLIGSTGSKKSRLVVMPIVRILAAAGESMIISDPKAEIYHRTAQCLKEKGYKIHVVNFRNPELSDGWNFLSLPYQLYKSGQIDKACEMVNDAAINLMPIQTIKDPYWDYSARDLFVGLTLLLFKICKDFDFPESAVSIQNILSLRVNMFANSDSGYAEKSNYWKIANSDLFIKNKLLGTVSLRADRTLSCILSTFDQHLTCFSLSPQLTSLLSETTFSLDDMGYEKTALYLILPDEKTTYHKLASIFLKESYENLLDIAYRRESTNRLPKRINYILDEFSSLPKISDFPQMISASRSRNIRFCLVMQSKKQLMQRYENETETIQSNCNNWMFLYTKELELLKEISALGGKKGNEEMIPLYRLQHLNKQQGECLLFSNRLFPYFAYLPDISEYDNNEVHVADFPEIKKNTEVFDVISALDQEFEKPTASLNSEDQHDEDLNSLYSDDNKKSNLSDEYSEEIKKELEAKFDELFGSLDDDDE